MNDSYKYRLRFSKSDKMKFIGHLDLLRIFQRAIKRANLPIEFSKGFNPHQQMSFAIPLSLGMTSNGEYFDFNLLEEISCDVISSSLNNVFPKGLEIVGCRLFFENEKSGASAVMAGAYSIIFPGILDLGFIIENILTSKEILIQKKTKSGTREVDIRQDIFDIKEVSENGICKIKVLISTGSERNLKPELLVSYIYHKLGKESDDEKFEIKYIREDLYRIEDEKFVSLYF